MKKAIAHGFCKDCRWSMDLPVEQQGAFKFHCAALPPTYEPVEVPGSSGLEVPAGARKAGMVNVRMILMPLPKKPMDFCSYFEPMPEASPPAAAGQGTPEPA